MPPLPLIGRWQRPVMLNRKLQRDDIVARISQPDGGAFFGGERGARDYEYEPGKPLEYDRAASGAIVQGSFGKMLRHPFSGVAMCYKHGIPPEVMHIVATHSHEGDKVERSIESIIFHHADFVDFDIAKLLGARAAAQSS